MELVRAAVFYALVAAPIAAFLGPSLRRQLGLALAALAYWVLAFGYAYTVGCHPRSESCSLLLALIVGGTAMIGWLVGMGLGLTVRSLVRALRAKGQPS